MIKVELSEEFKSELKNLAKKYKSIKKDVLNFVDLLEKNGVQGVSLGNNCFKARVKNSDNNKGKSGGYRIINFLFSENKIILLSIYSKSMDDTITKNKIDGIIKDL